MTENYPVIMRHIAVKDEFGEVGSEDYLCQKYGFTPQDIAQKAKELITLKKENNQ